MESPLRASFTPDPGARAVNRGESRGPSKGRPRLELDEGALGGYGQHQGTQGPGSHGQTLDFLSSRTSSHWEVLKQETMA